MVWVIHAVHNRLWIAWITAFQKSAQISDLG